MGGFRSPGLICDPETSLNYTDDVESARKILYTAEDAVIVPILMSVIVGLGLLTNSIFLLVVIRVHHMRTATNHYLVQIALADIIYLIFGAGEKVVRFAVSPVNVDMKWMGTAGCLLVPLLRSLAYFAVLFFMAFVTREKYLAICKPLKYRAINGGQRVWTTLTAWGAALLIAASLAPCSSVFSPYCITWPSAWIPSDLPSLAAQCRPVSEWLNTYNDVMQTFPFFLVMFLTLSMHICIIKTLRVQVAAQTEDLQGPITARKMQTRRQVTRMLVLNGILFFSLLAPFECCSIASSTRMYTTHQLLTSDQFSLLLQIARTLAYLQAAINPLVYYLLHPRYRKACVETFSRGGSTNRQYVNTTDRSNVIAWPKK
ncbi:thyrotropin-releasing hormone receptor-like [Patiria miniata]|uniref:G-protein coupled receptors family 1 profile domain-containing protein n=1 Tax=Patiria miniata TaxID=46514 RepID=A0A913ZU00_PATMI|nr:thyrotropin-releasing hormone receptor-like [Patiria miniata]